MVTHSMAAQRQTRQLRADDTRARLFAAAAELFAAISDGELACAEADGALLAHALMASYLGAAFYFTSARGSAPLVAVLAPLVEANIAGFRTEQNVHAQPRAAHAKTRRRPTRRRR